MWIALSGFALPLSVFLVAAMFAALNPAFLSADNIVGIVHRMATVGIIAEGMTFVVMTGGIDLSVGPVLAISGLASFFALQYSAPVILAVLGGVATGAVIGAINGAAVAIVRLPPIIVTLAMLSIVRGTALIAGGPILHQLPSGLAYSFIGTGFVFWHSIFEWLLVGVVAAMALRGNRRQRASSVPLCACSLGDPSQLDPVLSAYLPLLQGARPAVLDLCDNQSGLRDNPAPTVLCGADPEGDFRPSDARRLLSNMRSNSVPTGNPIFLLEQQFSHPIGLTRGTNRPLARRLVRYAYLRARGDADGAIRAGK